MAHRITLIITKELIDIHPKIPHFYDNEFLVIPFDDDGLEASKIEELSKTNNTFEAIFNTFLDYFWEDDSMGESNEINDFEMLLLVEFIERIQLRSFLIYHYSEAHPTGEFINAIHFKNRIVMKNAYVAFEKTKIDINNYRSYDACKKNYVVSKKF